MHFLACITFVSHYQPSGKTSGLVGRSAERTERTTGEALARRTGSGSGRNGEPTKHRTLLDSLMSSKATADTDKTRPTSLSRNGSTSRRAVVSSSKPNCGDPSDTNRTSRLFSSSSSRPSAAQRALQSAGAELRSSSLSKTRKSSRDDPTIRSFEMLSLSADRRK